MANFNSHRSVITCMNGCVASSQTLANQIGIDILKKGGNAADAAVAVAAALNLTEPCSTGLGGDAFCLFFDANKKKVFGLNASGRSPSKLTRDLLASKGHFTHGLTVTVPGAAAGWIDCIEKFGSGKINLEDILSPTIDLARTGFPVAGPWTVHTWEKGSPPLLDPKNTHGKDLLIRDDSCEKYRTPRTGDIFKNPNLANVLESMVKHGRKGFYEGWVAESIVESVKKFDGVMELEDLQRHFTTFEDPISIQYKNVRLWEMPPNGQGIVALGALNILKNFDLSQYEPNSPEYLHLVIEALKLSFADGLTYCADPSCADVPVQELLSEDYGKSRARLIKHDEVIKETGPGNPFSSHGDTVYFSVVDSKGNACSFINSNYSKFGTGIVPKGCGFSLQNRGANFSTQPGHLNEAMPNKRPYHTIIPAMVTDAKSGKLLMSYGVMGAFMQPQGHVQVLLNMIEFGLNPQQALDQGRLMVSPMNGSVQYEDSLPEKSICDLETLGHDLEGPVKGLKRDVFGKGQVIAVAPFWSKRSGEKVLWAGSDPRSDGAAAGY